LPLQLGAIMFAELDAISKRSAGYEYAGWVTYTDAFDTPRQTQIAEFVNSGEGVISLGFIGKHNCTDGDCPK
jgi:hypothetical protein